MMKLNLFGLLIRKSPMERLLEHYDKIQQSVSVINESLQLYIEGGNVEFRSRQHDLDDLESEADKIIRGIRNNLPRNIFLPVNKVLLLNYTSTQDNILDSAQEALNWLSMRKANIPVEFQKDLIRLVDDVGNMVYLLGPALKDSVSLVHLENLDWEGAKEQYQVIRDEKNKIVTFMQVINKRIYNSDLDFKDIYQLIHFNEKMFAMCHNCNKCAEILRSMIAR